MSSLLVAAALTNAPAARAQETQCDPGDREVRSLDFAGNHAFTDDELAIRVSTTPSSWSRRVLRIFGTRRCVDSGMLADDVRQLTAFYRLTGYYRAKIDTVVTPAGRNQVRVVFSINEGPPVRIVEASIGGLDSLPARERIVRGLYLRVGQPFDQLRLQADYDSIISRLHNSGYPNADILRNQRVSYDSLAAYLEPVVITGPFARFDGVRINVTTMESRGRQISDRVVKQLLDIDSGDVYRSDDIDEAQRNLYRTGAFRHVEVAADSLRAEGDSLVSLRVALVEDLTKQLDTEIGWATLDCFRTRAVYTNRNFLRAARRLELTGQLTKIGIGRPLASEFTRQNLCYSRLQDDPFSLSTNYFVGATVRQSALFGKDVVPAVSVYSERRGEYLAWLRTTAIGADLSLTKNLGTRTTPIRAAYTFEFGRTEAQPALLCAVFRRCDDSSRTLFTENHPIAVASLAASRVRTDNELAPTNGTILRAEVRSSSHLLGSAPQLTFNKGVLDGIWYNPVGFGSVLVLRLRGGVIYGGAGSNGGARLPPPQERLYAGGATSVRGFQQNELGDAVYTLADADSFRIKQADDSTWYFFADDTVRTQRIVPVGGNALVVANLEYRLRSPFLSDVLQFTLFDDWGQVWTRGSSSVAFGFKSLKETPGVGVRILSPLGPIQVNVGYNRYRRPDGPLFFQSSPDPELKGFAPLYCITPVSDPEDLAVVSNEALPVHRRLLPTTTGGTKAVYVQDTGACRGGYRPRSENGFLRRLTFTFSIGPDF